MDFLAWKFVNRKADNAKVKLRSRKIEQFGPMAPSRVWKRARKNLKIRRMFMQITTAKFCLAPIAFIMNVNPTPSTTSAMKVNQFSPQISLGSYSTSGHQSTLQMPSAHSPVSPERCSKTSHRCCCPRRGWKVPPSNRTCRKLLQSSSSRWRPPSLLYKWHKQNRRNFRRRKPNDIWVDGRFLMWSTQQLTTSLIWKIQ